MNNDKISRTIIRIRSILASYLFYYSFHKTAGPVFTQLTQWVMPKSVPLNGKVYIPRQLKEQLCAKKTLAEVDSAIEKLSGKNTNRLWPAILAFNFGLEAKDRKFAFDWLERYYDSGQLLPKYYAVQLVNFKARECDQEKAVKIFTKYNLPSQDKKLTLDTEFKLVHVNCYRDDKEQWLQNLEEFFRFKGLADLRHTDDGMSEADHYNYLRLCSSSLPCDTSGPLVSVIMSCYEAEAYIETSLKSLMNQTYANLEILVVDDCSPDGSVETVQRLMQADARIKLLRNRKNVGTYVSRNRALRASTGVYVTTQDSDDWSHPERIAHQVAELEKNPRSLVNYCAMVRMKLSGEFQIEHVGVLLKRICYPSLMYRKKEVLALTGYWDCVRVEADNEYFKRLTKLCGEQKITKSDKVLLIQLRRDGSLTTDPCTKFDENNKNNVRTIYRKAYKNYHKKMNRKNGRYDFENWQRPFPAPEKITVSEADVRDAANWD